MIGAKRTTQTSAGSATHRLDSTRRHVRLLGLALGMTASTFSVSAAAIDYTYDSLHRLTAVAFEDGSSIAYTYDAAGNRLTRTVTEDNDGDGIPYAGGTNSCTGGTTTGCEDNCPLLANAGQADLDADAQGNTCDDDDDDDGLLDVYETNTGIFVSPTNTGSDPLNSDTDGDGRDDGEEVAAGTNPNLPDPAMVPALGLWARGLLLLLLAGAAVTGIRPRRNQA